MSASKLIAALLLSTAAALSTAGANAGTAGFVSLDRASALRLVDPSTHVVPTILALWSIDCTHCKKNLALFASLATEHPGVRLITLATEQADDEHAMPLDRIGVPGARFAYGTDAPERLAHTIDPAWRGELPRTLFFDGRGAVVAISGVVSATDARTALGLGTLPAAQGRRSRP